MKKHLGILCLLLLSMLLCTSNAQVGLSPLYVRLTPEDRSPTQTIFTVINGSNEDIRFRATFKSFAFQGTDIRLGAAANSESDLSPYLRAAPLEFEVPAFSEQAIRVVALVPPSVLKREMRAALVLEPLTDTTPIQQSLNDETTGQVLYSYQFIGQMFLGQPGLVTLDINEVNYINKSNLQIIVSNNSLTSGIANISWEISRGDRQIASSKQAARFVVLNKGKRTYNLAQDLTLAPGEYTLRGTFGPEDGREPTVTLNPQPFTKTFTVK